MVGASVDISTRDCVGGSVGKSLLSPFVGAIEIVGIIVGRIDEQ